MARVDDRPCKARNGLDMDACRRCSSAQPLLTPMQEVVLRRASRGETAKEIAQALRLSVYTIKGHMAHAEQRIGASNMWEAFHKLGWIV